MGTTDPDKRIDEDWREYCAPPHVVTITSEFRLGRFPVTNREYREFVEDGGYEDRRLFSKDGWAWLRMKPERYDSWYERIRKGYSLKEEWKLYFLPGKEPRLWRDGKFNNPSQPVVGVSWFEAGAYCKWLTLRFQSGEITPPEWWNSKSEVSLPTEAQWEFAARGGEGRFYPWGNKPPTDDHANYNQDIGATSPVGAFPVGDSPNELGDMAGNVWEWCRDVWDPKAYQNRKSGASDPETIEGDGNLRAVRGGSWNNPPLNLAAPVRFGGRAWVRDADLGFRCCVAVPPSH
ncbi:MAG: SUMF1/EgtB/PvdO family nonheme iron enzyme [Verrucomicrobia bacterium]|nr:SUMF1/EgtB/PvdO family nonheme iron enzyme [Verrucomicrobiota bacterium]